MKLDSNMNAAKNQARQRSARRPAAAAAATGIDRSNALTHRALVHPHRLQLRLRRRPELVVGHWSNEERKTKNEKRNRQRAGQGSCNTGRAGRPTSVRAEARLVARASGLELVAPAAVDAVDQAHELRRAVAVVELRRRASVRQNILLSHSRARQ